MWATGPLDGGEDSIQGTSPNMCASSLSKSLGCKYASLRTLPYICHSGPKAHIYIESRILEALSAMLGLYITLAQTRLFEDSSKFFGALFWQTACTPIAVFYSSLRAPMGLDFI
jgi:hypothetical protein